MNIEEIKLITDALRGISGDASTAVMVWIALKYGTALATQIIIGGVILACVVMTIRAFVSSNEWAEAGKNVALAYDPDSTTSFYSLSAKAAIQAAINRAKELK